MLKRLFSRDGATKRKTHSLSNLKIDLKDIDSRVIDLVEKLQDEGYEAYIVGGCVRDLIVGLTPKDFDVATNARPEQVTRVFRRARIIGRRFKIVHVRTGREIVEVTTFRGHHSGGSNRQAEQKNSGVLVRDNVYGSLEDDAIRRDFTCNALYLDPCQGVVIDFCNGISDLKKGRLQTIGDPETRFCEDPVRMLRAIRFSCKLNLKLDKNSQTALLQYASMMREVSAARLFDEVLKLLMTAYAEKTFEALLDSGIFAILFPATDEAIQANPDYSLRVLRGAIHNTAERIKNDQRVSPFYLYAALLWPATRVHFEEFKSRGLNEYDAIFEAGQQALHRQMVRIVIPKRFSIPMQEVWKLQVLLAQRSPKRVDRALENPRFRAGYDFLLLRNDAGEPLDELANWWTQYQDCSNDEQNKMRRQLNTGLNKNRRRPGGRRRGGKPRRSPQASD